MKNALLSVPLAALILLLLPATASAFEVSGWIPYWAASAGTKDARAHISELDMIHPFAFTLQKGGKIKDAADLEKSTWTRLFSTAEKEGVAIVPTVMTSDGALVHSILSDARTRAAHIDEIVDMVEDGDYDGVDIDYEGKLATTKVHFASFLRELKQELGGKLLSCTIEARTPPDSLYRTVPATIEYANDFDAIDDACDRVNIMAYDQQRADLKLNDARKGAPYMPVADVAWVEKVVNLTAKSIDKRKIMIGVPTYGREFTVTVEPDWYKAYDHQWSVNPGYATKTAKKEKVTPTRNAAGELSYTYATKSSDRKKLAKYDVPANTPKGNTVAAQALAYANDTGKPMKFNLVWWSDAEAVKQKVELAKRLGVNGVAIFKIDGGEDRNIWDLF